MKPMYEVNCILCLRRCSDNAAEQLTLERFKEATDFVFTFEITYSFESNGRNVCQSCVNCIMEFYEYAKEVKTNQESARRFGTEAKPEPICAESCLINVVPLQMETSIIKSIDEVDATTDATENDDAIDSKHAEQSDKSPAKRKKRIAENAVSCRRCNKLCTNRNFLIEHMKEHLDCTACGKLFTDRASLQNHMKVEHREDGMIICDRCGKKLTKRNLKSHNNTMHSVAQADPSQCTFCFKTFHNVDTLRSHIKAIHKEAGRTFPCDVCQKVYHTSRSLRGHKARVHCERKYSCTICNQRFKSEVNVKEHMAAHTGVTLYECDVCGHQFNSSANMYVHIKRKHPVEWSEKQKNRVLGRRRRVEKI